jgi:hypothetical protein
LPDAQRITHCQQPENVPGPSTAAWADINADLGTSATSLSELVGQLSGLKGSCHPVSKVADFQGH